MAFEEYNFPKSITIGKLRTGLGGISGKRGYRFTGDHEEFTSSGTLFEMPPKDVDDIDAYIHPKNRNMVSTGYPPKVLLLKYLLGNLTDEKFNSKIKRDILFEGR